VHLLNANLGTKFLILSAELGSVVRIRNNFVRLHWAFGLVEVTCNVRSTPDWTTRKRCEILRSSRLFLALLLAWLILLLDKSSQYQSFPGSCVDKSESIGAKMYAAIPPRDHDHDVPHVH
jgi:hypothetical protein